MLGLIVYYFSANGKHKLALYKVLMLHCWQVNGRVFSMNINVGKSGDPDVASGSLAYMPKPDSSESTDEIKLNSKKEESKTMADIADELKKDDDKVAQIPVKASAPVAKEPKPPKLTKDEEPEVLTPEVIDGGDDEMPPLNTARPSADGSGSGGGKGVLIALLVIALIAAGAFAYLWWSGKAKADDLAQKNAQLTASNQALDKQVKELSGGSTATGTATIRLIPELGVTYSLTDTTKRLTYDYRQIVDSAKKTHNMLQFSSSDLIIAEVKANPAGKPACTADKGPLGYITEYTATDTVPKTSKTFKDLTPEESGDGIVKVGDVYYMTESVQATCSTSKEVIAIQTNDRKYVIELLNSLKESN